MSEPGVCPFPKGGLFAGGLSTDYREIGAGNILVECIYAHGMVRVLLDIFLAMFMVIADNFRVMTCS